MNLPDFAHMMPGDIAGYLIPLAALVWLVGLLKAATSLTILWTYTSTWLTSWLAPALILIVLAIVGQGVPPWIQPNVAVQLIFIPAVGFWVATALAAIAKNFGLDLSKLPLSQNVKQAFEPKKVEATTAATSGDLGDAT